MTGSLSWLCRVGRESRAFTLAACNSHLPLSGDKGSRRLCFRVHDVAQEQDGTGPDVADEEDERMVERHLNR